VQNLTTDSEKQRTGRLFSDVLSTFKRKQHRETFEVMMNLFLTGQGQPLPELATVKSPSAVSRFLNHYTWNVRAVIRAMRQHALDEFDLFRRTPSGRQSRLELIVDMTSLPKEGKFEQLAPWVHHFNGVSGVHLVVLYLCRGSRRFPWSFLVWRGKGHPSPADLALKMLARLPEGLVKRHSRVPLVLADAGFCSKAFIAGMVQLGLTVSVTIPAKRMTAAGQQIRQIKRQGEAATLPGLPDIQLWLYRIWLSNSEGGARERRYVVSTLNADPYTPLGPMAENAGGSKPSLRP
jgi:hypothetical protein